MAVVAAVEDAGLPASVLDGDDAYGPRMRAEHAQLLASPGVGALLAHCGTLGQVRAGVRWRAQAAELVAAAPRGAEAVRELLAGFAAQPEGRFTVRDGDREPVRQRGLTDWANTALVRGLLWALADLAVAAEPGPEADPDGPGVAAVRLAGACARHAGTGLGGRGGEARTGQVATTAVAVLGSFDGDLGAYAVTELAGLRAVVRNRTVLKAAERAQLEVAGRAGLVPSQLRERTVPTAGLDAEHRRAVPLPDGSTAVLAVDGAGAASLTYRTAAGRRVASVPASARKEAAAEVAGLKGELRGLRKLLAGERSRLEELLASGATWSGERWQRLYADHPLVGAPATSLLWEVRPAGGGAGEAAESAGWRAGFPERAGAGWVLAAADGTAAAVGAGDTVRLWHPLRAEPEEVQMWRTAVAERELRQPFKQAFREVYPLTPAEEASGGYSNRFAAHVLRFGQVRSLMAARGWSASHLGFWDGGDEGEAIRVMPAAGPVEWRARFDYQLVEESRHTVYGTGELCSSNRVRFERRPLRGGGRGWTPVAPAQVPPLVLSEALRDVDLFVGVASIAADEQWRDAAEGRLAGRWHEAAFGPLPPSAEVRKEALARLLPRTRIAGRVELDGRFLRVRGDRTTYRIHLGSGNVLMEPNDAYLCVVPAGRQAAGDRVFLPFEAHGGLLAVVLSKAFLLADDARITDPSIVRQLPPLP